MRKPLSPVHAKTLHKINDRGAWISSPEMGWDVTGLYRRGIKIYLVEEVGG